MNQEHDSGCATQAEDALQRSLPCTCGAETMTKQQLRKWLNGLKEQGYETITIQEVLIKL